MTVVILCGGMGTRIRDVNELIPKPMVPVGPYPILWHIMKLYDHFGYKDFVLCLGYKKESIIDYFTNYMAHAHDVTVELGANPRVQYHRQRAAEDWRVTLADTGLSTMTGSRIRRAARYLDADTFMLTYGDGVSDIDINALIDCHQRSGKLATISAVHPSSRYGEIQLDGGRITAFAEKPQVQNGYINGGFMVLHRQFIDRYIDDDTRCILEEHALPRCCREGQLNAFRHDGFWQCMDTAREHIQLNQMWESNPPWKLWRP